MIADRVHESDTARRAAPVDTVLRTITDLCDQYRYDSSARPADVIAAIDRVAQNGIAHE